MKYCLKYKSQYFHTSTDSLILTAGLLHCRHEAPGPGRPYQQLRDHQDPAGQRSRAPLSSPSQVGPACLLPSPTSRLVREKFGSRKYNDFHFKIWVKLGLDPPLQPGPIMLRLKFDNPAWFRCGCEDCAESRGEDSLRHSRRRINAYRALASPSLIALSSKDPILTAFKLSWELRELAFAECEFKSEYMVGLSENICILSDNLIL